MQTLFPFMLLSYPLVLHLSTLSGQIFLAILYLALLLSAPFLLAIVRRSKPDAWHILSSSIAVILAISAVGNEQLVIKLVPLAINGALFWIFGATLISGKTPLVTRFASLMRDSMPPAVMVYTRRATLAWTIYFLMMFMTSLLLAIYAPVEVWSLFSNVISYLLLVLMFLAEYSIRRMLVHEHMDYSFIEFVQRLRHLDIKRVLRE